MKIRLAIVIALIIYSFLLYSLSFIRVSKEISEKCSVFHCVNKVALYGSKFKEIKNALPKHGTVGYLTNEDIKIEQTDFYVVRYNLTPTNLEFGTNHPFVISDFHHPVSPAVWEKHSLIPIKDYGNGVILFKKKVN